MNTSKIRCQACGWWDIGMKYGPQRRCTQCGAALQAKDIPAAVLRPPQLSATAAK